ncbi:MAG: ribonuclease P protein component [Synechococcaceae cyanobacterium SM2_3_1]|nr:ribonuclease P protein component [Synechococcaceae cyanobacterium SM2_3_1]
MLPRQHRLKSSQAFHLVYKQGTSFTAKHLRLVALKHPQCSDNDSLAVMPALTTRIGLSVSKKVSKHAVVRNRIRRQLRSSFRQLLPFLSPGWLLVVVAATVVL